MQTKKIESEESLESMNSFKRSLVKRAIDININDIDLCLLIRGKRSVIMNMSILDYASQTEVPIDLCKIIAGSEMSEKSFHQVDYIILTNFSECGKIEEKFSKKLKDDIKGSGSRTAFKEFFNKKMNNLQRNKKLSFFIFSRKGICMEEYDVIESFDKKGNLTGRVIAPEPIISYDEQPNKKDPSIIDKTAFVIMDRFLVNPFDEAVREVIAKNEKDSNWSLGIDSFDGDFNLYDEKSDFIKERDLMLSKNSSAEQTK